MKAITNTVGERIRRIRGASPDPFVERAPEPEAVRESSDPWVKRLLIAAVACFVLMVVLFLVFNITLGSGASAVHAIASQVKG